MWRKWALRAAMAGATALVIAGSVSLSAQSAASLARNQPASSRAQQDPRAIHILKAVGSRLGAARTLTFAVADTAAWQSRDGTPLSASKTFDVTLQRPNKLRV